MFKKIAFFALSATLTLNILLTAQTASSQTATIQSPVAPSPQHTLLDGTPVKLRLTQTISSAEAKVGQMVTFEVTEDVKVDGIIVLPKGSSALANVTEAEAKRSMGRAGKLNISISYARLADQEKLPLRAVKDAKGGGHVGAMAGAMVATSIVFFPAAPLFLFVHGKDITIPQGTEVTAFVEGDTHLDMSKFVSPPSATQTAPNSIDSVAHLAIGSLPDKAEIFLDGNFVGTTPSNLEVPFGNHEISIRKKGFQDWTRKLNASSSVLRVVAELEASATK